MGELPKPNPEGGARDARVVALEEKVAYQEHHIAELDEVLREFGVRVVALEDELRNLRKTLDRAGVLNREHVDEPPPHY
jgi:uncharacterized coiled-coil protein SlyX